jgi:hypothetical protein
MKSPLTVLLRVKKLKEEQALKDANAKREAASRAAEETARAEVKVKESRSTLSSREDCEYQRIIGQVVTLVDIDDTKARVVQIQKGHQKLVDAKERADHVQAEADAAREASIALHRRSLRSVDTYVLLTDRETAAREEEAERREELEIEDLFSTNRRGRL